MDQEERAKNLLIQLANISCEQETQKTHIERLEEIALGNYPLANAEAALRDAEIYVKFSK